MKITLVQSDITAAVRAHILSQGIGLDGKTVEIKFAMKKKGEGVVADVSIDELAKLPDLTEEPAKEKPRLKVVATVESKPVPAETKADPEPAVTNAVAGNAANEPQEGAAEDQATDTDNAAIAPVKTTSLFN